MVAVEAEVPVGEAPLHLYDPTRAHPPLEGLDRHRPPYAGRHLAVGEDLPLTLDDAGQVRPFAPLDEDPPGGFLHFEFAGIGQGVGAHGLEAK